VLSAYFQRMKSKSNIPSRKPISKILWSGLGAFLGIYMISIFGHYLAIEDSFFLLGSFGASAVLLYGAPQAEFSQPRNLIGGHVISAFIAVSLVKGCGQWLSIELICALSVSLSIIAMHFSRTMHPPGGATALIYAIGSEQVSALGWYYPLTPIGLGALIMLLVALFINNFSKNTKRHYPLYWW